MEYCDSCGKAYEIVYDVPDDIWDKITLKKGDGFLCIECANKRAEELGIDLYWSANKGEYLSVEMERLKKEKEWLVNKVICSDYNRYGHLLEKESEELLIDEMQQALKK